MRNSGLTLAGIYFLFPSDNSRLAAAAEMTLNIGATEWTDSLLPGESLHRGYPRGASRWQQASNQRQQPHHARSTGEDRRVKSRHVEKHRLHGSACQPCSDYAQYGPADE